MEEIFICDVCRNRINKVKKVGYKYNFNKEYPLIIIKAKDFFKIADKDLCSQSCADFIINKRI